MSWYGRQSTLSMREKTPAIRACRINALAGVLFISLVVCSGVSAQVTGGTISGSVTDPSGAAIPGAAVSILNRAKGEARDGRDQDREIVDAGKGHGSSLSGELSADCHSGSRCSVRKAIWSATMRSTNGG